MSNSTGDRNGARFARLRAALRPTPRGTAALAALLAGGLCVSTSQAGPPKSAPSHAAPPPRPAAPAPHMAAPARMAAPQPHNYGSGMSPRAPSSGGGYGRTGGAGHSATPGYEHMHTPGGTSHAYAGSHYEHSMGSHAGARPQGLGAHAGTADRARMAGMDRAHAAPDDRARMGGMDRTHSAALADHGHFDTHPGRTAATFRQGMRGEPARPFLHADAHRDVMRDRAFVAAHAHDFHSHNVRDFNRREFATWRHGAWRNEWHYGRRGWWWEAGGAWYPYADPIFPFPLEVAALVAYDEALIDGPSFETYVPPDDPYGYPVYAALPGDPQIPPLPAAPPGYYQCPSPNGYYPDVSACPANWSLVPDAPPDTPQ